MQVKLRTFNKELIRGYMESSSIMEQGITYMQHINHSSRAIAKETAIRQAMEFCERKWYNDSTGYISNEWIAFTEFEKDVKAHRYFYVKGMKSEAEKEAERAAEAERQEKLWEKEYERARKLREYCKENNLDFETENKKELKKFKVKNTISTIIIVVTIIALAIPFIKYAYNFLLADTVKGLIGLGIILVICVVVFIIVGLISPHEFPKDFFEQIDKGKYKFDHE